MFLKWLRARRLRKQQEQLAEQAAAEKALQKERQGEAIRAWDLCIKTAGMDYDAVMACGEPPEGSRKYFTRMMCQDYPPMRTSLDIYEHVSKWPGLREDCLSRYEHGDPVQDLDVIEELAHGVFPYTPKPKFVFGEGADRAYLQQLYDAKLAEAFRLICESPPDEARRTFMLILERMRDGAGEGIMDRFLKKALYSDYEGELMMNLPVAWNDLVARFVRTPRLGDFSPQVTAFSEAEVLQVATQALTERSLTKAKLVLAYVQIEKRVRGYYRPGTRYYAASVRLPYREMVGDELVGKLSALVEELHAENGLFVTEEASN